MIETKGIVLDDLLDLVGRLDRIRAIALDIERAPDKTYSPLGSFLAPVEWYSLAAVTKSTSNAHAFCTLVEGRNTIAAIATVRMQIEAAMRLYGLTLVDDVEAAGAHLMAGNKFGQLKSREGVRLADKVLHEALSFEYAWVTEAYEDTSAFVHLDGENIKSKLVHLEMGAFFNLSGVDAKRPEAAYFHLADTFFVALRMTKDILLDFLRTRPQAQERAERLAAFRRELGEK
ncbi:hypothetical protein [Mesorhizobium captivum]|uniref:hypothetical protein n=1 Tax=Mesorhizobium captivum TaxID=3072319 RepID=UPI002A247B7A|nr:hypothetical protein [Mesorhizobium sp. VK22E]MDX8509577.1 hypothetical protein [Mesorhizobium sp. VK22E]